MNILGLSFDYHDSAAALIMDGQLVAAATEERFTRRKHDPGFPGEAAGFCLREGGIGADALDAVAFYEDTLLKFDRVVTASLDGARRQPHYLGDVVDSWLALGKFDAEDRIAKTLGVKPEIISRRTHHRSHAASAFYCAPFEEATIVTLDGVGEYETLTVSVGRGCEIDKLYAQELPHSLGLFYSAFTAFLGFEVNEGEYKVMGLAAYGTPRLAEEVGALLHLEDGGRFEIEPDCFEFQVPTELPFTDAMTARFGPPRTADAPFRLAAPGSRPRAGSPEEKCQYYADLAASLQKCTEDAILHVAAHAVARTGISNLCLAGGVGLNSLANGRIRRELGVDLFVQPAAGDGGGALGAALDCHHARADAARMAPLTHVYLGAGFTDAAIQLELAKHRLAATHFADKGALAARVAELLEGGAVVGWMQGRAEWGPRALGNRSILANPTLADMQEIVNRKIKFREPFRPFAPSVLAERAAEFFELTDDPGASAPERFMLSVASVRPEKREIIPAVTHADGTARLHLVDRETNPLYHDLIRLFGERTGVPVLLNSSLNARGEAMADTPYDALETFSWSEMDYLVMGGYLLAKEDACAF